MLHTGQNEVITDTDAKTQANNLKKNITALKNSSKKLNRLNKVSGQQ